LAPAKAANCPSCQSSGRPRRCGQPDQAD
jgi:hypothetical protein